MKTQNDNSDKDQNATCDNAVLSSRLFKFRAFNPISKRMFLWNELEAFWSFEDISRINNGNSSTILMQFTGLKDKKGIEIYEGDILDCGINKLKVVFENGYFRTPYVDKNGNISNYRLNGWIECEVIGNIFENPELL